MCHSISWPSCSNPIKTDGETATDTSSTSKYSGDPAKNVEYDGAGESLGLFIINADDGDGDGDGIG